MTIVLDSNVSAVPEPSAAGKEALALSICDYDTGCLENSDNMSDVGLDEDNSTVSTILNMLISKQMYRADTLFTLFATDELVQDVWSDLCPTRS